MDTEHDRSSGDISSAVGYIRSEIFSTMGPLLLLILAIGAGARAIAGEEEGRTLDLLLANPVRRRTVVLQKFWAMVASTSGVGLVLLIALSLFGPAFGLHIALVNLAAAVVSAIALAVCFGAIALAVGCWRGRRAVAVAASTSLAVVLYLLNVLAPSVNGLSRYQVLSPFYHYIGYDPLRNGFSAPPSVRADRDRRGGADGRARDVRAARPGVLTEPGQTENGS